MEAFILNAVSGPEVIALVALLAANLILSILAALQKGTFSFRNLADFVPNRVVPLIAYFVVAALADFAGGYQAVAVAVYAGLVALYSTGVLKALKSMGLKLPDVTTEKDRKPKARGQ